MTDYDADTLEMLNDLDAVCAELGIQDEFTKPVDAIRRAVQQARSQAIDDAKKLVWEMYEPSVKRGQLLDRLEALMTDTAEVESMGLYDSDTGESLKAEKVVDVSHLTLSGAEPGGSKQTLLVYATAKRGRIVQLRQGARHIHYFIDESAGQKMMREDEPRFGFGVHQLLQAVFDNAPTRRGERYERHR